MFKKRLMFALLLGALFMVESPIALVTNAPIPLSSEIVIAGSAASHAVTIMQQSNGTASLSTNTAAAGSTVTVTATPSSGYVSGGIAVADAKNNVVTTSKLSATEYAFVMPDSEATVIPVFLAAGSKNATDLSTDNSTPELTAPENGNNTSKSSENKAESVVVIPSDSTSGSETPMNDNAPSISVNSGGDSTASASIITSSDDSIGSANGNESTLSTPTTSVVIPSDSNASHASSGSESDSISGISYADDVSSGNIVPIDDSDGYMAYASVADTSGVVVPSGGSSVDSSPSDHIVSGNNDGTISSTIVIPSENGTAEPDVLPIGDVIVPGSHMPAMTFPDSSSASGSGSQNQAQTGSDTKMIYSKTQFEDSVSTVTGTTQVPDVLDTIGKPDVRLSSRDGETVEEKGIPSPKILSATVPLVLPIRTAADGKVIVPTNAEIMSDVREGNICVDSAITRLDSGWVCVCEGESFSDEVLNGISISLRQDKNDKNGILRLTKERWNIRPKKKISLDMGTTLTEDILLTDSPVNIEFVLGWADS